MKHPVQAIPRFKITLNEIFSICVMFYVLWWGGTVITRLCTVLRGAESHSFPEFFHAKYTHSILVQPYDVPHNFSVMCFIQSHVFCSTVHTISTWCSQPTNLNKCKHTWYAWRGSLCLEDMLMCQVPYQRMHSYIHACTHRTLSMHKECKWEWEMGAEKYKKETQFYFAAMTYIYFHMYQH